MPLLAITDAIWDSAHAIGTC